MPRPNAKGKWGLKDDPNTFYAKREDPFNIKFSKDEKCKNETIAGLIIGGKDKRGLDLGCGEGVVTEVFNWIHPFRGVDISPIAISRARNRCISLGVLVMDITKQTFWDEFDTIILNEVLYYIEPEKWSIVVNSIQSMLKKDGQFIISVGQYFTEEDIREIFKNKIKFDKVYKLPNKKYGYWLIMSGHRI